MLKLYSSIASSSASRWVVARALTSVAQESAKVDVSKEQSVKMQPSKEDVDQLFSTVDETKNKRKHAFSMNRVELIGGVAEAPIQRVTRSGGDYVTFNMITNAEFRRQDGERSDQSELHSISVFGRAGDFVLRNIQKGTRVFVSGRIHYQTMTRDDGARMGRMATINAEVVQPLAKLRPRMDGEAESDSH
uniref:Telomerase reverse transcriptase n=1 Tax=Parascaris univalens TaxID=6257 RepID=A0A915BTR3_PARUN